ncbi:hypothetical protein ILYODFUR_030640 [Ilyodon furcidens]|uniref:Uncharacterized protein n=1 Tax=Ilyodon furcidens TaxID=33524 RepID=A0ABV0UWK5_9TELE
MFQSFLFCLTFMTSLFPSFFLCPTSMPYRSLLLFIFLPSLLLASLLSFLPCVLSFFLFPPSFILNFLPCILPYFVPCVFSSLLRGVIISVLPSFYPLLSCLLLSLSMFYFCSCAYIISSILPLCPFFSSFLVFPSFCPYLVSLLPSFLMFSFFLVIPFFLLYILVSFLPSVFTWPSFVFYFPCVLTFFLPFLYPSFSCSFCPLPLPLLCPSFSASSFSFLVPTFLECFVFFFVLFFGQLQPPLLPHSY